MKEAVSIGTLAAISCEDDSGSDGTGQYSPISMKNILSAFVILLVGVGTFETSPFDHLRFWIFNH